MVQIGNSILVAWDFALPKLQRTALFARQMNRINQTVIFHIGKTRK